MLRSLAIVVAVFAGLYVGAPADHAARPAVVTHADPAPQPLQSGACGDGRCEPPEDSNSCPSDCGSRCGDGRCAPPEDCNSCPRDCGSCCGDGRCAPPEDCHSCPRDCGGCR